MTRTAANDDTMQGYDSPAGTLIIIHIGAKMKYLLHLLLPCYLSARPLSLPPCLHPYPWLQSLNIRLCAILYRARLIRQPISHIHALFVEPMSMTVRRSILNDFSLNKPPR